MYFQVRQISDTELINQKAVDDLVAQYASKAVELDFVKTVKNSDSKQSFLLGSLTPSAHEFIVPADVPDKSQWVVDDQVCFALHCAFSTSFKTTDTGV